MKHNNFIENKKQIEFRFGKFELDYLVMILLFAALVACMVTIHSVQQYRGYMLQQELQAAQSSMPAQAPELKGVEWSALLRKYTSYLPGFVRVREISLQTQNGDRMLLALLGTHVWDATRARENLVELKICNKVNLGKIQRVEDKIYFELECSLS